MVKICNYLIRNIIYYFINFFLLNIVVSGKIHYIRSGLNALQSNLAVE